MVRLGIEIGRGLSYILRADGLANNFMEFIVD